MYIRKGGHVGSARMQLPHCSFNYTVQQLGLFLLPPGDVANLEESGFENIICIDFSIKKKKTYTQFLHIR